MKKILLGLSLTASLAISPALNAQTIPNAGFETWVNNTELGTTYQVPQNWIPFDMLDRAFNTNYTGAAVTKTAQSHSGTAAALMQTVISGGDTAAGVLISTVSFSQFINGLFNKWGLGFTFSQRPAALTGFYKLTSVSGDYAFAEVFLTKWNTSLNKRDTIGIGLGSVSTSTSTYTSFSIPIQYTINVFPDSACIVVGLGATAKTHVGSQVFVDDLAFTGSVPFGVQQFSDANAYSVIFPNPVVSAATIHVDKNVVLDQAGVVITDALGKEILRRENIEHETKIEKGNLPPGIYLYQVTNAGHLLSTGKFVIE